MHGNQLFSDLVTISSWSAEHKCAATLIETIRTWTGLFAVACVVALISFSQANASRASAEEMELVCQNWLTYYVSSHGDWAGSTTPEIVSTREVTKEGKLLAMCFDIAPDGFVVVPVLKELPPVKACSETGYLDLDEVQGCGGYLKDIISHRVGLFEEAYGSIDAAQPASGDVLLDQRHSTQWSNYAVSQRTFRDRLPHLVAVSPNETLGPLLTTSWSQTDPFWNLCPMCCDNNRCVVGCVATSWAQIMAYWQWPLEGDGESSYHWNGDYDTDCNGYMPGRDLSAQFSDPYDWDNMPERCDFGCTSEQIAAVAELNYEVGVAVEMGYGAFGSGSYSEIGMTVLPQFFAYKNFMSRWKRSDFGSSPSGWFSILKAELNELRPIHYTIPAHAIVCDGWRDEGGLEQYHMNYGWGGPRNLWYTVDDLHWPEGQNAYNEHAITGIQPNRDVVIWTDDKIGFVPFEVDFIGDSDLDALTWRWKFGDGDSALVQSPTHVYNEPGLYDINLKITASVQVPERTKEDYVLVLADTLIGGVVQGAAGGTVEYFVHACNTVALQSLKIPIELDGNLAGLAPTGFSTAGCRTSNFDNVKWSHCDPAYDRYTFTVSCGTAAKLLPGSGPVLKVTFSIPGGAEEGQWMRVSHAGYLSWLPTFRGDDVAYDACTIDGMISVGEPNDVNDDESIKPDAYRLEQNYPNPFNPSTVIDFSLKSRQQVELTIHNMLGQKVVTLLDDVFPMGEHSVQWDGRDKTGETVTSGIYFYRLQAGSEYTESKKMLMLK